MVNKQVLKRDDK